jgi:hypothetical protein
MGMIRKTLSIGTLGLVNFRSKKEKLARSEANAGVIAAERDLERAARLDAETRAATAQVQLKLAKREAAAASKQAAKLRKRGKRGKRAKHARPFAEVGGAVASAVKSAEPAVRSGVESAKDLTHEVAVAGKKIGKQARKQAKPVLKSGAESARELSHEVAVRSRKFGKRARKQATPVLKSGAESAQELGRKGMAALQQAQHAAAEHARQLAEAAHAKVSEVREAVEA